MYVMNSIGGIVNLFNNHSAPIESLEQCQNISNPSVQVVWNCLLEGTISNMTVKDKTCYDTFNSVAQSIREFAREKLQHSDCSFFSTNISSLWSKSITNITGYFGDIVNYIQQYGRENGPFEYCLNTEPSTGKFMWKAIKDLLSNDEIKDYNSFVGMRAGMLVRHEMKDSCPCWNHFNFNFPFKDPRELNFQPSVDNDDDDGSTGFIVTSLLVGAFVVFGIGYFLHQRRNSKETKMSSQKEQSLELITLTKDFQ